MLMIVLGAEHLTVGNVLRIAFILECQFIYTSLNNDICCFRVDRTNSRFRVPQISRKHPQFRNYVTDVGGDSHVRSFAPYLFPRTILSKSACTKRKNLSYVTTETVAGLEAITLIQLRYKEQGRVIVWPTGTRPDWPDFIWSPPVARPPAIAPDHLSDARYGKATQGYWCTDFVGI